MKTRQTNPLASSCTLAFASVLFLPAALSAAIVTGVGEPTGPPRTDSYAWAGFGFYVPAGSGATVNRLGYWDEGGDGLQQSHTVALFAYEGTGRDYTEIASVTIPAGTDASLESGYRWVAIPDLFLPDNGQGGNYYVLMASHGEDAWTSGLGDGAPMHAGFGTLSTGALDRSGDGPVYQISSSSIAHYGGPNLGYVVPEASSSALVGLAFAGLALRRRR